MTIDVTLTIEQQDNDEGYPTIVAARLVKLGGPMVSWQPEMNDLPARATFKFRTQAEREKFLADALRIPGVAIESRH